MTHGSNIPCQETDICIVDSEAPSAIELDILQTPAEGLGAVINNTLQHVRMVERMDMITEDTKHNKRGTQWKEDLQAHDTDAGISGIVHQIEDVYIVSVSGDMKIDDKDTNPAHHGTEWTQEDIRHSPRRNKKMKVEKAGEYLNERTRSMSRLVTHKNGKA